ncbi:MAG: CRISPR-associated helicase Cas3' [Lachnospiraceae bacterium]|nr:CRISPR-associated helicase Cas3' [Lachnospiraceae bacterium]
MKKDEYIAHRAEDGHTQTVKAHLEGTAALAEQFASAFGAAEWGRWAGLAHDIGKYSQPFQRRIRDPDHAPRTDHSTAGAQEAFNQRLLPISFAVAGHHAGLPDFGSRQDTADNSTLAGRLRRQVPDCNAWRQEVTLPQVSPLPFLDRNGFTDSFFTRMLYSCLVDADFLDTETFMQAGSAAEVPLDGGHQPRGDYMSLSVLLDRLTAKTDRWLATDTGSTLNRSRNDILRACIEHGEQWPRGLYTLTVPTGGGKTTASLAFALRHALAQGLERVVYVIPYTSIIDQTVEVFQEILGPENVLAHYGEAAFRQKDPEDLSPEEYRQLLAAENWDAPLVVTTAVQFFESLYANRSSRCRKLHNLARSVVIFDEAQTLPLPYLRPCCAAIAQLVEHYRATAVLCTATQPALGPLFAELAPSLRLREICPGGEALYLALRRCHVEDLGNLNMETLALCLQAHRQVLCVVNRRKTAQQLYATLPKDGGSFCLTTLLCAADRRAKLTEIRQRLKSGLPCRVVSTSLIEAGVDVDFPVAYREEAGLDSLLQTAGRCNREGKESDPARCPIYLFALEDCPAPVMLRPQLTALRAAQRQCGELDQPDAISYYFKTLYNVKGPEALDQKNIMAAFDYQKGWKGVQFPFATVAKEFVLIESPTKTVYLPIDEGAGLCEQLQSGQKSRTLYRKLGPYSVEVYKEQYEALYQAGALNPVDERSAVLTSLTWYDRETGLKSDAQGGQGLFL